MNPISLFRKISSLGCPSFRCSLDDGIGRVKPWVRQEFWVKYWYFGFFLSCQISLPVFAQGSFESARVVEEKAYADYMKAAIALPNPTPEALKKLKTQWIDPASRAYGEAQQADLRENFPFFPVPQEAQDPQARANMKAWHQKRIERAFKRMRERAQTLGSSASGGRKSERTYSGSLVPVEARSEERVETEFPKEIEFKTHKKNDLLKKGIFPSSALKFKTE